MAELVRRMRWDHSRSDLAEPLLMREWLVTNGLGGYASGTVAGVSTRRYHGLLIAALPAPHGRVMTLAHIAERLRGRENRVVHLSGEERASVPLVVPAARHLLEFRLEEGLPVWEYMVEDIRIEKRLMLAHEQNTVLVSYRLLSNDGAVRLKIRPSVHFRFHDAPVSTPLGGPFSMRESDGRFELTSEADLPPLRMTIIGRRPAFTVEGMTVPEILYRIEESRGYEARGDLWSPGYFRVDLAADAPATLVASTESWEVALSFPPEEAFAAERERRRRLLARADPRATQGMGAELVLAADQFIVRPPGRVEAAARARATGDEPYTVIAGYHWFTDWGRDTMISHEGLTLVTGRREQGASILRMFAQAIRDGLIPNLFPEGEREGLYHTADATLWFFHAIQRYVETTGDRNTLDILLPRLVEIVERHLQGTRFGIRVDPADGLLVQGAEGYQLTWMDAKVGDWVVTPRRGKAVEINALWYNALALLERWLREHGSSADADTMARHADRAREFFNQRFWYDEGHYLYDVVDGENGDDAAFRPNQILSFSLDHPVLRQDRWEPVLNAVRERLLTPVGLRSLAPEHPAYKEKYYGDLRARDAAYHQGTVWAWLVGPFIDAYLRVHPGDHTAARQFLQGFEAHLGEACVGSISEIFDASEPFTARGCIAQAWSVAEALRCWVKTAAPAELHHAREHQHPAGAAPPGVA